MSTKETRIDSLTENRHIADFLDEYFTSFDDNNPPGYAVLLSGEWGCGKTFVMKEIIKGYAQDHTDKDKKDTQPEDFIYISLYGMNNLGEIDTEILRNIYPALDSDLGAIATISSKWLFNRFSLGVNNEDLTKVGSAIQNMTPKQRNKIFIFDDLERCSIDEPDILGYINNLVEHSGRRVVLLSNEDKIFSKYTATTEHKKIEVRKYKSRRARQRREASFCGYQDVSVRMYTDASVIEYKEKIIGRTFKVTPYFDGAFDSFIKPVKDEEAKELLKGYSKTIRGVYKYIGNNNLRSVKQAIIGFPHFIQQFPDNMLTTLKQMRPLSSWATGHTDLSRLDYVIHMYFYLSLGERAGRLSEKSWKKAVNNLYSDQRITQKLNIIQKNAKGITIYNEKEENVLMDNIVHDGILGEYWYEAVVNGKYVSEILVAANLKLKDTAKK